MNPATARILKASTAASNVPEKLEDAQVALKVARLFSRTAAEQAKR